MDVPARAFGRALRGEARPNGSRSGLRNMILTRTVVTVAIASCAALVPALRADEVLDQQNDVSAAIADSASSAQEIAQTFTVGVNGTLSRIEVLLARFSFTADNAILTVYSSAGGVPDASLGSAMVSAGAVSTTAPTFVSFDLSALAVAVSVEDVLAFSIHSAGSPFLLPFSDSSTYAGGSPWRRTLSVPPGPWQAIAPPRDYGFRVYVDVPSGGGGQPGDYNGDEMVDAADYTVWRNHLGEGDETALNDNGNGMNGVDPDDYDWWKTHYEPGGGGSGGQRGIARAVPEPAAIGLSLPGMAVLAIGLGRRRAWR
jgi:hypothetical protein